ncbi:MAG: LamG domain-containing protein [Candidatus Nitrosoabyssus spongiisocia]|nr:MAG: LamG domain-containing protein [Nitrosopumilaceae archaeon AB1(1)]
MDVFDPDNLVSAQIGNGLNFDGVNRLEGDYLDLPNLEGSLFNNTGFTISAWANIDTFKAWSRIAEFTAFENRDGIFLTNPGTTHGTTPNLWYEVLQFANQERVIAYNVLQTGQWAYLTVVHESLGNATIYHNGISIISAAVHAPNDVTRTSNYIGKSYWPAYEYFDGKFDEFRLSSTARSADWIATEYANQNSPSTFFTISAPEDRNVAISSASTNIQGDNIIITFSENITYSVIPTTDFTLNGTSTTIDSITSNSSSITLNLSRKFLANATIAISYTKTSGEINSTQNTDITLESFVNQPVNNNVPKTPPVITSAVYQQLG